MFNKSSLSILFITAISCCSINAAVVTGLKAGQLHLANIVADETSLTIEGNMNAADFSYIFDNLNSLQSLNLEKANILAYNGEPLSYTGISSSPAATLPSYSLCGLVNLSELVLPTNIISIGKGALSGSGIVNIRIPASVKSIGDYAFMRCPQLKSVEMSSNVTSIGTRAFAYCPLLASITLSSSLPSLPDGVLEACGSLKKINLEELAQCQEIGSWALAECSGVTTLVLPEDLETLGKYSLYGNSSVETLVLPQTLIEIQDGAMGSMTSLTELLADKLDYIPDLGSNVWSQVKQKDVKLVIPDNMISAYENAEQWKNFNIIPVSQYMSSTEAISSELASPGLSVSVRGGILTVSSAKDALGNIAIFNPAGTRLAEQQADRECTFNVGAWAPGVYLVVSNAGVAKVAI